MKRHGCCVNHICDGHSGHTCPSKGLMTCIGIIILECQATFLSLSFLPLHAPCWCASDFIMWPCLLRLCNRAGAAPRWCWLPIFFVASSAFDNEIRKYKTTQPRPTALIVTACEASDWPTLPAVLQFTPTSTARLIYAFPADQGCHILRIKKEHL